MKKGFKSVIALFTVIIMIVSVLSSIAGTVPVKAEENKIYVAITGSDTTGDGTSGNPYRTLYFASRHLGQGTSMVIGGGIYGFDDALWITSSGTPDNPVVIAPAPGETVSVNGGGRFGSIIYAAGVSNVVIKDINFYGVTSGAHITSSKNLTIDGCSFVNLPNLYTMTITESSFCTVQNCYFDTNGGDLTGAGDGDAVSSLGSTNLLIQNNYFTKNGHYSVTLSKSASNKISQYNIIRENYIDQQWGGGVGLILGTLNTVIEDNLIKNSGQQCIQYPKNNLDIAASTTIMRNNLLLSASTGRVEYQPSFAFDGDDTTAWISSKTNSSWLGVDLGSTKSIDKVVIDWAPDFTSSGTVHHQYFAHYQILVSTDGQNWTTAKDVPNGTGNTETVTFNAVNARFVKMNGLAMATTNGNYLGDGCSINEFKVYNSADQNNNLALNKLTSASSAQGYHDDAVYIESYPYNGYNQDCIGNRLYNNVIYGNGGAAVGFSQRVDSSNTNNKVVNNIMYKNRVNSGSLSYIFTDTSVANAADKWTGHYPNYNYIYNNMILSADNISQYPGNAGLFNNYDNLPALTTESFDKSLNQVESDYPTYIHDNKESDPLFTNEYADDFRLSAGSPAIDTGASLAKTTVASDTPTTQVTVDDALFFTDGYGIVAGDSVVVGQNAPVKIMSIDYSTNTLTLESAITYSVNDPVNLPFNGTAPDMGAIESNNDSQFPTAPSITPPVQTLAPTPTPTLAPPATPTPTPDLNWGTLKICDFNAVNKGNGVFQYTITDGPDTTHYGISTDKWTVKVAKPYNLSNMYEDNGAPDSTMTYKFQGTKARLFGEKSTGAGMAGITILDENGNVYIPEQIVDCYEDTSMKYQVLYTTPDLPYGIYSIKLRNLADANSSSPYMQYDPDLQRMTPNIWTINLLKLEVFDGTHIPTQPPTPTPKLTPSPKPTPTPTPVPTFSDVGYNLPQGWATDYILALAAKGVINGYSDGTFRPSENIKRCEFIKILTVAFNVYDPNSTFNQFSDVKASDWFYAYVASGVNSGLASSGGLGDGTFGAQSYMTREQMVTFSARAIIKIKGYTALTEDETNANLAKFNDASDIGTYARDSVALCVSLGILDGYKENGITTFKPKNNINRAEVSKITSLVADLDSKQN